MAKYTDEQMKLIRADYESGIKPKELGTKYDIPVRTISSWVSRRKWGQIVEDADKDEQLNNEFQKLINERPKLTNEQSEIISKYAKLVLEVRQLNNRVQELTNENNRLNNVTQELTNENQKLINELDNLTDENQKLIIEHDNLTEQLKHIPTVSKIHNERNAGRKVTLEYDVLTKEITSLYSELTPEGKRVNSQRNIADMLGISLGTVNKVIQESKS